VENIEFVKIWIEKANGKLREKLAISYSQIQEKNKREKEE